MLNRSFSLLVLSAFACFPVLPQAVISTHSGVINVAEGSVSIDSQPFAQRPGKFTSLKEGSTLRTEDGRAEVLLTPNVILRVGANSAIRMVSNSFADTRVEFLSGSAILESQESADTPATILYKDYEVQSRENSTYKFDSGSAAVTVLKGKAKVSLHAQSLVIGKDQAIEFTGALQAKNMDTHGEDVLDSWAKQRDQTLEADDDAASKTTDDLSVAEGWLGDSGLGDSSSGISPSSPSALLSPYGVSPNAPDGSLYVAPLSPVDTYSSISPYGAFVPGLPYPFGIYVLPVVLRPSRVIGINPVLPISPFGSRPVSGFPIWHPRTPATVTMPTRPSMIGTMPSRPPTRPAMIAAPRPMAVRPMAARPMAVGHR
ncbi:MAG TPA: FecR domain-containing protein [Bryobacteraceae bacterium]|nr:FecR domain-containing protein [Bryobacteraceae bacterium]